MKDVDLGGASEPHEFDVRGRPHFASDLKRRWSTLSLLGTALVCAIIGGLAGASAVMLLRPPSLKAASQPSEPQTVNLNVDIQTSISQVVREVGSSVVTVINQLPPRLTFFSVPQERSASGSGVIISNDGYIVTNNHVIDGAQSLSIVLADGTQIPAELVGVDPYADLAVLRTDEDIPAAASWGNSDLLDPGEPVIAIGSPLGDFKNTVTQGVVSATNRSIEVEDNFFLEGLIQTDAAINRGNSGGPLLNLAGQIVGINTLIVRGGSTVSEGLGFAIASNTARAVVDQLIRFGRVARPYLGIRWVWITPSIAARYHLPLDHGIILTEVVSGGPADQAGLVRGDILLSANGETFDADHPYQNVLFRFEPGEAITFELVREGTLSQVEIILGTTP
jgi:2-alkenal reductase